MKYRWEYKSSPEKHSVEKLAQSLFKKLDSTRMKIASLLVQRGITTFEQAKTFFRPSLEDLHNPFLMKDMQKAIKRILQAIQNQEKILIYGDYDVDGTTSVALLYSFISTIYDKVTTYIPDRYTEGYGVSFQGIDYAFDNDISLIITLDCGIKDNEKVLYAHKKGIDFIICDHHNPSEELPKAVAILNPKQKNCMYPYKELCGCGVGFKLVQALVVVLELPSEMPFEYLDLVAVAIAADIVPITGENRILTYFGLQKINKNPSTPIDIFVQNLKKSLTVTDLVFVIAPRINAAGRMKHGMLAVQLLIEKNHEKAKILASELENFNAQRKQFDEQITYEALQQIIENQEEKRFTTVVFNPTWHKGVIGIVASRLTETYYRPTLVFTQSGKVLAASARSVSGFDIYKALEQCSELLIQFGGHKYAAGLTLLPENYLLFKEKFEKIVSQSIDSKLLIPKIEIDTELSLKEISSSFYSVMKQFAPFGPLNMTPIFLVRGVINKASRQIGTDTSHLRLVITDANGSITWEGIGFGLGNKLPLVQSGMPLDIVYSLDENTWNGATFVQLRVRDIKLTETQKTIR